ncbi:MAG: molybdenum cofactor guanylyltransferase [Candidatus Omnitrophota bacterium]
MTAIILAGGKSSRFGSDKAFIKIYGKPLIERQVKILKNIFKKIIIVTNNPGNYKFKKVKVVKDIIAGCGPLSGIHAGLVLSDSFYNFVVSCDMPNLSLDLIRYLISIKDGFDVVVPKLKNGFETLFAIYSKNCILPIYELLRGDNLRVTNFFDKVKLKKVNQEKIIKFGDTNILFMNINTRADLALARKMLEKDYD